MNWLRKLKAWFTAGTVFQDTLAKTIAYLPVGDLLILISYQKEFLPYTPDFTDGVYDKFKEYMGAALVILLRGGDCEDLAAFFSEIIRAWFGWESWHVRFVFREDLNDCNYLGHDVAFFKRPDGSMGWIEAHPTPESNAGGVHEGGYDAFERYYLSIGWYIEDWWPVNDMGERIS